MLAIRVRAGLGEITCPVGIMLMRPLLLHASSKSRMGEHRRVIHIEYVACDLPAGLSWGHLDVPVSPDF